LRALAISCLLALVLLPNTQAQQAPQKPAENTTGKASTPAAPQNPAQIELLETKVRFESNGDSRKEVHARVHINSELGVRQFARLNFDYNRSFQSIEIPLVRITHASGGIADILPSAITDNPNPAVVNAPAYQDVRVKSVRILGLQPGDLLEYRVITTTSHHPLAPDFWLDHSFDRSGVVSQELFELDLPASRQVQIRINAATPASSNEQSGEGNSAQSIYRWERKNSSPPTQDSASDSVAETPASPDVALSTFGHWRTLSMRLADALTPGAISPDPQKSREERWRELFAAPKVSEAVLEKAGELTKSASNDSQKTQAIYDFVSTKIVTIDLPLGATGFSVRTADAILSSGYATQEEKFVLFEALAKAVELGARPVLTGFSDVTASTVPMPSVFKHLYIIGGGAHYRYSMDPSLQVAPFGIIPPIREKFVFLLNRAIHLQPEGPEYSIDSSLGVWLEPSRRPPFPAFQRVAVDAVVNSEGTLTAKVKYTLRGENELTLRVAFHHAPKEKWTELAQLLSLSDGFRGKVTTVTASDPYATKEPFTVEYELAQPKFVDWSKKPVRIPALLPQLGLPDPPAKPAVGAASSPIELGTPLEVATRATLHLPPSTTVQTPTGTAVQRDYATYASQYSAKGQSIIASRHINFLLREIPADRAADYNAFLHAVQNDEAQDFTLEREDTTTEGKKSAAPKTPAAPSPAQPKP
jgi:Domain of Unknown Function with PDB structure (DUF3857)